MQLQTASRKKAKIKMALQGPSGSGKTKSALLIAYGLCGSWEKIGVIDTENRSADLYADLGPYNVLPLIPPFTPERYIEAIGVCIAAGIQVIIVDSVSHEWEGTGGILEAHSGMLGNSFTNWAKLTPRHNAFVQTLLQADVHIISNIRTKQEYVLSEKNGKQVPEKVGMKGITREGMDYEFTVVLDLDMALKAKSSKDRTQLFFGKPEFIPTVDTGAIILKWCNDGIGSYPTITKEDVLQAIASCQTNEDLLTLYNTYPAYQQTMTAEFSKRRMEIETINNISNNQKAIQNGAVNS
ncbi:AAA family ATPase [Flavipsychrobacter stenotrophus]|uniref:AAA family ATPase n=1 Tax=Flavipsychrobacter stenotrophus TaxID=2077091 RepID=A0A2S7SRI3_9BACT|nr:AAA family ATPase [Flavipsychrobacter stenotrophus]PQJ09354.1 AAA family ATPase [Flavipsychrobacter stenotrophus]